MYVACTSRSRYMKKSNENDEKWRQMAKVHWWPPTWRLPWLGSHGAHQREKRNTKNAVKEPWRPPHIPWRLPCSTKWLGFSYCTYGDRHKHHDVRHAVRPLKNCNRKNSVFHHSSIFSSHNFYTSKTADQHMLHYI